MSEYILSRGFHTTANEGRCAMEWVAFLAGEPHSDNPKCVSPLLRDFCIALNDLADAEGERQKLRPYLARTIGTRGDGLDDWRRGLCREFYRICSGLPTNNDYIDATRAAMAGVTRNGVIRFGALDLLDRMLPTELIQLPAVSLEEASAVCGVDVVCS